MDCIVEWRVMHLAEDTESPTIVVIDLLNQSFSSKNVKHLLAS